CESLGEQGLATARRTDQQDVAFRDLDIVLRARARGAGLQSLVVIVDGDREHLLGALLADHVLVQNLLDLVGLGQLVARTLRSVLELLANDVVTQLDTLVANKHRGASDELANFVLTLSAERAVQKLSVIVATACIFSHRRPSCARNLEPRRRQK